MLHNIHLCPHIYSILRQSIFSIKILYIHESAEYSMVSERNFVVASKNRCMRCMTHICLSLENVAAACKHSNHRRFFLSYFSSFVLLLCTYSVLSFYRCSFSVSSVSRLKRKYTKKKRTKNTKLKCKCVWMVRRLL